MIAKLTDYGDLREAGTRMSKLMRVVLALAKPGVSSWELEEAARKVTKQFDSRPSYLGYSEKDSKPYPAALCVSINQEIAHSPPQPDKVLRAGDVVSIDFGLEYKGYYMDAAYTLGIGQVDTAGRNLIEGTQEALAAGIAAAQVGGHTCDIGAAVSAVAKKYKLGVVAELRGHGVGIAVHELPYIDNVGRAGQGEVLKEGLVIAIEPIFAEKSGAMVDAGDGFTFVTRDGSRAAHFEHTVLLTKEGPEILT